MFQLKELLARLQELGIQPKKSLGQNFLVNTETVERIVDRVIRMESAALIEIGPGLGALTESLCKLKLPYRLIELDSKFSQIWRDKGMEVIEADALKIDWSELKIAPKTALVSNLPYQISASLVIDRSLGPDELTDMVLMFQKEVGQRIQARVSTEDYGLLSVMAQVCWRVEKVLDAGPKDFYPPPQVGSRVLAFFRRDTGDLDREKLLQLVKQGFGQRRKKVVSNLSSIGPRESWEKIFAEEGLSLDARAESLTPEVWVKLTRRWSQEF